MSEITRDEFHMLRDAVTENSRRLDQIDMVGTRGVGALAVQVTEVIRDVSDLRLDLKEHRAEHETDARARSSARRWGWAFGISALAAVEVPLFWLLAHVHG
jgi:hypothetical protein